MELLQEIKVRKVAHSRIGELDFSNLVFGKHVSDHMLVADFEDGRWQEPQIVPYGNLSISPAAIGLHYGQSVFEGLKAFRMDDGRVNIFRLQRHYERMVRSLERMCMAVIPADIFIEGIRQLVALDRNWVPGSEGAALYIRPLMYATEARFGVKPSESYRFLVFTGPVGPVFNKPVRVKVETEYVRAARGGTGSAKCSGNYGGAFYPTQLAREAGFDQVLWTDAKEHEWIEESGMMNVMFVIHNRLVTPPLSDSILDGVTRDTLLTLARDLHIPSEERPVSVEELELAFRQGTISEAFGAGTAAVVSPIQVIHFHGHDHQLPSYNENSLMFRLKNKLEEIRKGTAEDRYDWNTLV